MRSDTNFDPFFYSSAAILTAAILFTCDTTKAADAVSSSGATTTLQAVSLANRTTFGPTEGLIADIIRKGRAEWVQAQFAWNVSRYTSGGTAVVHSVGAAGSICDLPAYASPTCSRDYLSTTPLTWDFYRNAVNNYDQLRQRTAFAMSQILVVSNVEVFGTYGFREYQNLLLSHAFGNWRHILREVALSPLMGDYLGNVNNNKVAPNENFARELMQLFSIGQCQLNLDGTMTGGVCQPTYDNDTVRNYAFALTGWTYPDGGRSTSECFPRGANCRMYSGRMKAAPALHDTNQRALLSGITVPVNSNATQALDLALDSLMAHPNMGPFLAKRFIQHFVTDNPSPAYVERVATAFNRGEFVAAGRTAPIRFGTGVKGDMKATIAAVVLDAEADGGAARSDFGRLREPALLFTGVLRALDGQTDGDALGWQWGSGSEQHVFRSPTVFNYYMPDQPVTGTALVGPVFGIMNAATALQRLNFLTHVIENGTAAQANVPNAVGTFIRTDRYLTSAADAGALVDRLSIVTLGRLLPAAKRRAIVDAVNYWTTRDMNWQQKRVKTAAFLLFASPEYQILR